MLETARKGGKKHSSDIPEGLKATLQGMVKRGLVKKRVAKEEVKRKIYGRRLVCTITEKGVKAHEALKTIKSL